MTVKEFKEQDSITNNAIYGLSGGIEWLTGMSSPLPSSYKQEWDDYQLLLAYSKAKVSEYKRTDKVTDDTKMDDVWKMILEKE